LLKKYIEEENFFVLQNYLLNNFSIRTIALARKNVEVLKNKEQFCKLE